jgi:hypothetical protein
MVVYDSRFSILDSRLELPATGKTYQLPIFTYYGQFGVKLKITWEACNPSHRENQRTA